MHSYRRKSRSYSHVCQRAQLAFSIDADPLITCKGRDHYGKILFEIKKLVEAGKIKPLIHKDIFDWKQVSQAHKLVESKMHKGKVVLKMD